MAESLAEHDPCGHTPTTVRDRAGMLRTLYAAGFGYHQIADLAGMSHEDMRGFLAAGTLDRQAEYLLARSDADSGAFDSVPGHG